MTPPQITIVLPIIDEDQLLVPCLNSVATLDYPQNQVEVILVDNGVSSNLKRKIKKQFPKINFGGEGKNLGFAKAVNLGIKKAKGDWIFITNSDVVLEKKCFLELTKIGESNSKIGIWGPLVYSLSQRSKISRQDTPGFETNLFWGILKSLAVEKLEKLKKTLEVDWVSGSGMMVKKEVIERIGLLDERFFLFWEDADLGIRAKKAGFKVVLAPQAKLYHQGSAIAGKNYSKKTYYLVRNCLLFLSKHTSLVGKLFLHLRNLVLLPVKLLEAVIGIKREESLAFVVGILDFYRGRFGEKR